MYVSLLAQCRGLETNAYIHHKVPYIVLEAPSNLLLKRAKPSVWQARIIISWGIALLCHVPVSNKGGIYATRFLLGLFEAGMFPGVILQMTYWYRPDEMSIRLLYFCTFLSTNQQQAKLKWLSLTQKNNKIVSEVFPVSSAGSWLLRLILPRDTAICPAGNGKNEPHGCVWQCRPDLFRC